jgi:hypothetical protein
MVKLYENVPVQVQFEAPPGEDLLIEPSGRFPVRMTVRASASQYALLKHKLESGSLTIMVEDTQGMESREVLKDRLAQADISDLGISIESTDPPNVSVRAERKVQLTLPIAVVPGDVQLVGSAACDPPQAIVHVPASLAPKLEGAAVEARLGAINNVASLEPNVPQEFDVPLRLGQPMPGTEIVPAHAKVRFTIERRTGRIKLPLVRVAVVALPSVLERFDITLAQENRILRDVTVKGPADAIARIEAGTDQVWAELQFLSGEEMKPGTDRKLPELRLPPNVTLDSSIERVEYRVERRQAAAGPQPPPVVPEMPLVPLPPVPSLDVPAAPGPEALPG